MESPDYWNALSASLAVCDLTNPHAAWAFVVVQGLVRDDPGDRDSFLRLLREEQVRGNITGPSIPFRVAGALIAAGLVRPAGMAPDPWGKVTGTRLEVIASWGVLDSSTLVDLRRLQEHVHQAREMPDPQA